MQATKQKKLIKPGTIWQLGPHRIVCGDARDKELVRRLIGQEKINLLCCDVPYGVGVVESKRGFQTLRKDKKIANDQLQSDEEYIAFTTDWLNTVKPHLAQKNSAYIFNADKMIFALREGMLKANFKFAQLLVWIKSQAVIGRLDYAPMHELIAYGWCGTHAFRRSVDKSVLFYRKPSVSPLHPTTKPHTLITRLVLNSSEIGDVVYDGFLGSGTTLFACDATRRRCFGVELDPEYVASLIERFEFNTGIRAIKL